jgi:Leucine-rich repeat (LRR) protein
MNKNKLTSCRGLTNLNALESLSLQENEISSLEGLSDLPKLKRLDLSNNKLESLSSLSTLENLEVLTLDGNPLANVDDLFALNRLPNLVQVSLAGTGIPEAKGDDLKKEILIACERLTKLKKINGEEWTEEDRQEAMNLKRERIQEALNKPPAEEAQDEAEGDE